MYLCLADGGAAYTLTVDGHAITTKGSATDPACSEYTGAETLLSSSGVSMGSHNVQLKFSSIGAHDFRFFGGIVTMGVTSGRCASHIPKPLDAGDSYHKTARMSKNARSMMKTATGRWFQDAAPPTRGRRGMTNPQPTSSPIRTALRASTTQERHKQQHTRSPARAELFSVGLLAWASRCIQSS